jgi:hypothetical protein
MEHYSKIIVRLVGHQPKEYVTSVTENAINEDWNSPKSELKGYMKESERNDSDFFVRAAGFLGRAASEKHCSLFQWVEKNRDFEILRTKPENLGKPILLDSDHPHGITLWLIKSHPPTAARASAASGVLK